MKRIPGFLTVFFFCSALECAVAQGPTAPAKVSAFEPAPVFQASQVLPPQLLAGAHHRVRESAPSDGYLMHFTVDSDFGTYQCIGIRELKSCVAEIGAIATLVNVSKGDLFAQGIKQSLTTPIDAAKNIVERPGESIRQLPQTVGHFFSKVGSSIQNAGNRVDKRLSEGSAQGDAVGTIADTGKGIGSTVKSVAGFDKAKLDCARQLGINPYTDNPRLQEEIEKVTWAFFAGGLPLRVGAAAASGGASVALTSTKVIGLPGDIYDVTPGELALRDRQTLTQMGVPTDLVDAVFLNASLNTSSRHSVIQSLGALPSGPGQAAVVRELTVSKLPGRVAFLDDVLSRLAQRHQSKPYRSVGLHGRLPVGITPEGSMEVLAPVDFVTWTEHVAAFATLESSSSKKHLIVIGKISQLAGENFTSAGWTVTVK